MRPKQNLYSLPRCDVTKYYKLEAFNNKNLFSHCSEDQKSKIKVLAIVTGPFPLKAHREKLFQASLSFRWLLLVIVGRPHAVAASLRSLLSAPVGKWPSPLV